ncbi:WhiB family transcriptional regulator [Streptomyces sp. NPDC088789]|uniref:WhiB family transcriptional regulator n=1 Tax=Streptomyces sp. NPDC088789 TaxID=3365899 RepID=UPI0037FC8A66
MHYITTNTTPTPVLRGIADHSWHARSACRGLDPTEADRLFFPTPRDHRAITQAKALCARCPVKKDCFNSALEHGTKEGIWGGLTEKQLTKWRKETSKRLDYNRVRAAFLGRDVHLSPAEREAVTRHAYVRGWTTRRLAHTLRLDYDYARDLMRKAAHAVADRDRYWDLYDATDEQDQDEDQGDGGTSAEDITTGEDAKREDGSQESTGGPDEEFSPVSCHVHTQDLITALGRAA